MPARSDFPTTSRNIIREVRSNLSVAVRVNAPSTSRMCRNYNYTKRVNQEKVGLCLKN